MPYNPEKSSYDKENGLIKDVYEGKLVTNELKERLQKVKDIIKDSPNVVDFIGVILSSDAELMSTLLIAFSTELSSFLTDSHRGEAVIVAPAGKNTISKITGSANGVLSLFKIGSAARIKIFNTEEEAMVHIEAARQARGQGEV